MANDQGTFVAYRNWVEDVGNGQITASRQHLGNRVSGNIKTRESDDFWRFPVATAATSTVLTVDFGQPRSVGVVTSQFPRGNYPGVSENSPVFSATDTIRVRLLASDNSALADSTAEASMVQVGYMSWFREFDPPVTANKLEMTFDAASRIAAGFCDVGSVGAWPTIAPKIGFSYPAGFGWVANNESHRTPAGRPYTSRFEPHRIWQLQFDLLTNPESMQMDEMLRYSGGARQVFVRRGDLPAGKDSMHALVTASRDMESVIASHRQVPLTFEEFI